MNAKDVKMCIRDRFKGGRKANVEVHGGASLEEVAVPIIEITRKQTNIEAFILDVYKRQVIEQCGRLCCEGRRTDK